METIHVHTVVEKDGELALSGLPLKAGQPVEVTVKVEAKTSVLTAKELAESEIVGLWADRKDIQDSAAFAEKLREQAQRRW